MRHSMPEQFNVYYHSPNSIYDYDLAVYNYGETSNVQIKKTCRTVPYNIGSLKHLINQLKH